MHGIRTGVKGLSLRFPINPRRQPRKGFMYYGILILLQFTQGPDPGNELIDPESARMFCFDYVSAV